MARIVCRPPRCAVWFESRVAWSVGEEVTADLRLRKIEGLSILPIAINIVAPEASHVSDKDWATQ